MHTYFHIFFHVSLEWCITHTLNSQQTHVDTLTQLLDNSVQHSWFVHRDTIKEVVLYYTLWVVELQSKLKDMRLYFARSTVLLCACMYLNPYSSSACARGNVTKDQQALEHTTHMENNRVFCRTCVIRKIPYTATQQCFPQPISHVAQSFLSICEIYPDLHCYRCRYYTGRSVKLPH